MKYLLSLLLLLPLQTRESTFNRIHHEQEYLKRIEQKKHSLLMGAMWVETRLGLIQETRQSRKEKAVGILQIRPGMVEYLRNKGYNFTLEDRKDSVKSVEMFFAFQELKNPEYNYDYGWHIWNAGHNNVINRWHLTEGYRKEAHTYLWKMNF